MPDCLIVVNYQQGLGQCSDAEFAVLQLDQQDIARPFSRMQGADFLLQFAQRTAKLRMQLQQLSPGHITVRLRKSPGGAAGFCVPPLTRTVLGASANHSAGKSVCRTSVQLPAVPMAKS